MGHDLLDSILNLTGKHSSDDELREIIFWLSSSSDSSDEEGDDPGEYVRWLASLRPERTVGTYEYAGDFLPAVLNTHSNVRKRWSSLPPHVQAQRWLSNFRMYEDTF